MAHVWHDRPRMMAGQLEFGRGMETGGQGGGPPPITSSRMGHLLDALERAYQVLGSRSAVASLRTTCSGVCFFLVAMLMSSLPAHKVGRKTLKRPGSTSRGTRSSHESSYS
jgi:hypothetical protein